jgi:hypothetical protein
MIFMWTDTAPGTGGTYLALDSVGHQARIFARHPEGLHCTTREMPDAQAAYAREHGAQSVIELCSEFHELVGCVGDVALVHPWMLHAASGNPTGCEGAVMCHSARPFSVGRWR